MKKSKFQKKKDREKEVRKKILIRREAKQAKEREVAKLEAEARAATPKQQPILNKEFYEAKRLRDLEIRMQLEANMELLKGLQEEYEQEFGTTLGMNLVERAEKYLEINAGATILEN